ncbi:MAG: hypothetical protein KAR40_07555 [Candidatus Sabulitectum sp.]|nr:hypothetical protein [Candidatus Sabulitectum sp.]
MKSICAILLLAVVFSATAAPIYGSHNPIASALHDDQMNVFRELSCGVGEGEAAQHRQDYSAYDTAMCAV